MRRFKLLLIGLVVVATMWQRALAMGVHPVSRSISLGDLTFTGVYPRIFTPNGDGANDKAVFHFDNPELLPVQGHIYDLTGASVADLKPGSDPLTLLLWDGRDSDSRLVPGGIYIYEIDYQGHHATGTVVVAH